MQKSQSVNPVTTFILATWRQWAFSLGLIILLVALSPIVSRFFIAYVAFAFAFILGVRIYIDHTKPNQGLALPFICTITLFLTGILITTFNITDRITGFYELAGHEFNDELPQIVQLAVAPMLALTSGIFILKRLGRRGRSFRTMSGRPVVSLVQRIVWQETRYQTRLLFWITTAISIADWSYCFYSFSSISLNKPDRFFFVWLPIIVYFLSLIYVGFRCFSVWALYSQANPGALIGGSRSSIIRYLIVHENSLYLSRHNLEVLHHEREYFDTPVRLKVTEADRMSGKTAERIFSDYTGIDNPVAVKFLFSSVGLNFENNIQHFICNLASEVDTEDSRIKDGNWMTLDDIRMLDRQHLVASELSSELVHLHTVAMASRTYDIDGNRRYSIKGYRPTYRLCDIKDWSVDFDDPRWVKVAYLNADKPFFRVRRFFHNISSSIMR